MLKLKQTAVAVLALGSSAVFAGTMGPVCTPGNVTVPCEATAFDVAVHALYLQPTYTGAFAYPAGANNNHNYSDFDHDYEWGFRLEGSYHFSTGNDLTVNWTYWSNDYFYNPDNVHSWNWEPTFNQVNVEFGQHVDFGEFKNIRFHGGVQYVNIEHDIVIRSRQDQSNRTGVYLKYNGFGPRTGMDMSYDWDNGLSVYVNSAAALTVGDNSFRVSQSNAGAGTGIFGVNNTAYGSHTRVVPELEAKIGGKYTYAMASGDLTLDAGWLWMNYFNAQHIAQFDTDFALNGPYIGLKYVGNV
jgi:hypothetical protein